MKPIAERDWKRFVLLKKRALERYCRTTLADVAGLCAAPQSTRENEDSGPSAHEQYLDVYWLVQERNKQMARAFDGHSRSRAPLQLMALLEMGLVTDAEVSEFSDELQSIVFRSRMSESDACARCVFLPRMASSSCRTIRR